MEREKIIDKIKQLFGFIKIHDQNFSFTIKIYGKNHRITPIIKSLNDNKINLNIKEENSNINIKIKENSFNSSSIKIKDSSISEKTININSIIFKFNDENFIKGFKFGLKNGYIKNIAIMKKSEFMKNRIKIRNIQLLRRTILSINRINLLKYNINSINGTLLIKRLPVKRKRQFIVWTKELQLSIWKQIIEYTKNRPTELEIIGIFSKIPIRIAQNIKINYIKKELLFSIKQKNDKLYKQTNDVVIVKGKIDGKIHVVPLAIKEKINENSG